MKILRNGQADRLSVEVFVLKIGRGCNWRNLCRFFCLEIPARVVVPHEASAALGRLYLAVSSFRCGIAYINSYLPSAGCHLYAPAAHLAWQVQLYQYMLWGTGKGGHIEKASVYLDAPPEHTILSLPNTVSVVPTPWPAPRYTGPCKHLLQTRRTHTIV